MISTQTILLDNCSDVTTGGGVGDISLPRSFFFII